jgi:uncharacterized protein (DUF3820 family)
MILDKNLTFGPDHVMTFGKYVGASLEQIACENPGYIVWLARKNILSIKPKFLAEVKADYDADYQSILALTDTAYDRD